MPDLGASEDRLFQTLAAHIKSPLLQIARTAELGAAEADHRVLAGIQYTADMALQLVDSYVLSVQLQQSPVLDLEPVSVGAVLQDAAHALGILAKQYDCQVEVRLQAAYEPVMAHRAGLLAAMTCLARVFVESVPEADPADQPHRVVLAEHRDNRGRLVAGVFSNHVLNGQLFRQARALHGRARVAGLGTLTGNAAGVFIAESLLASMSARLRVARHDHLSGLGVAMLPSHQLSLL